MDHVVQTRQQYWGDFEQKWAEATGTNLMPNAVSNKSPDPGLKSVIPKVGSAVDVPEGTEANAVAGEQPVKNPQAKPINPRVDVSGKEPPTVIKKKEAQYLALPSAGRYPLDSYRDVEKAASYFDQWGSQFSPVHRREFCSNLVKRASVLGIPVSSDIEKYGAAGYAPVGEIKIAVDGRKGVLQDEDAIAILDKLAEARPLMSAELFAETLSEFDKVAGIDHMYDQDIVDPYYTTFGKMASNDGDNGSQVIGNDVVTNKKIKAIAQHHSHSLDKTYGADFVKEFKKDPIGIFNSLPIDQKKHILRQANDDDFPAAESW